MPELRQNTVTGDWVILATERARRPADFCATHGGLETEARPAREEGCPFCPGNEGMSKEVLRLPRVGPWGVRVVKNKYPALSPPNGDEARFIEDERRVDGLGYHEVLIESPLHNTCPALEAPEEIATTLQAFQSRGRDLAGDPRVKQIIWFKNHGQGAGASLEHPHTQLIALPVIPRSVHNRERVALAHLAAHRCCVLCQMVEEELREGRRIVYQDERVVAFIPFAAFSPFHVWLVPRRHEPDFLGASAPEIDALARAMRAVLGMIYRGLGDPDYNYVIHSRPLQRVHAHLHWYLAIVPRVSRAAGFEFGSGMFINTAMPRESAAFLRQHAEAPSASSPMHE